MTDIGPSKLSEGLECCNTIQDEECVGLDNVYVESHCLTNSFKNETVPEEKITDGVAVIVEKSDVQPTMQVETAGSMGSSIILEDVLAPVDEGNVQQQPFDVEEDKDIETATPFWNLRMDSSSSDNKDSQLVQSQNKDDSGARTEPTSINTFLLHLESQVDGMLF